MRDDLLAKFVPALRDAACQPPLRGADDGSSSDAAAGGSRPYIPMLTFVTVEQVHHAFPYAHLLRVRFDPSAGIRLHFATHSVTIRGQRLLPLYNAICSHTVDRVTAVGERHEVALSDPKEPLVVGIAVRKAEGGGTGR